jgi:Tfp pilus assembly protein PilW
VNTIASEKGYSILEVLISAALGVIVLAGAFDVYISSTKSIMGQANIVQMQADTKAAMDIMVADLRMAYTGKDTIDKAIVDSDTITFYRTYESGYATGGTTTSLTDSSKNWIPNPPNPQNPPKNFGDGTYFLWIKTGAGSGQAAPATITGNNNNTLTLASALAMAPSSTPSPGSLYFIVRQKTFTTLADSSLYSLITGGTYHLLAQNVTQLQFHQGSPCNPTNVCITLSTRSKDIDQRTKDYRTYSLTSSATPRN